MVYSSPDTEYGKGEASTAAATLRLVAACPKGGLKPLEICSETAVVIRDAMGAPALKGGCS